MNLTSLQADPAAGFPLPVPGASVAPLTGIRRLASVGEGIVFWGILSFGVLSPFAGAVYALLRS